MKRRLVMSNRNKGLPPKRSQGVMVKSAIKPQATTKRLRQKRPLAGLGRSHLRLPSARIVARISPSGGPVGRATRFSGASGIG